MGRLDLSAVPQVHEHPVVNTSTLTITQPAGRGVTFKLRSPSGRMCVVEDVLCFERVSVLHDSASIGSA